MITVLIFGSLWMMAFGVLFYLLKPTGAESAFELHLMSIGREKAAAPEAPTILKQEKVSSIPWVQDMIKRAPGTPELTLLIKQSGKTWRVSSLVLSSAMAGATAGVLVSFFVHSAILSGLVGIAVALSPSLYLYFVREARFKACSDLLPEAVDLMTRALRAGHAISSTLEMAGREVAEPLGAEFRTVSDEHSFGLPLRDAVLNMVQRVPRDDVRFLAAAILLQKETGGNLANILDKTATVMRERKRMRGQMKIYTAQGRATGWVMCCIPFILFLLIGAVNPSYERLLFTDPIGTYMIYAGLALLVIGMAIIRKIVNIRV